MMPGPVPGLRSWSMQRWARTPSRGESDTGRQATTPNRASLVSHAFGLPQTYALGEALERLPEKLVGLTVDIADASLGVGFTPPVAAAVPKVITAVLEEFGRCLCDSAGYPTTSCDSPARTASSLGCLGSAMSANRSEDPIPGRQSDVDGQRCLVSMRGEQWNWAKGVRTADLLLGVLSEDVVETRIPASSGLGGRRSQR